MKKLFSVSSYQRLEALYMPLKLIVGLLAIFPEEYPPRKPNRDILVT